MKKYLFILLVAMSCADEYAGPCGELAKHCKELQTQMDREKDPKAKEQIRQYYLSEKHNLDGCKK